MLYEAGKPAQLQLALNIAGHTRGVHAVSFAHVRPTYLLADPRLADPRLADPRLADPRSYAGLLLTRLNLALDRALSSSAP